MGVLKRNNYLTMVRSREDELIVSNYNEIIRLMSRAQISEKKLEEIKSHYKTEIDSIRRYEWIKNLEQLFIILERRCVISCTNISKIYDISKMIGINKEIGALLILQSRLLDKRIPPPTPYNFEITLLSDSTPTLPETVIDFISCKVKLAWQQFARALFIIREGTIDKIDRDYEDNEEKTRQVLLAYLQEVKLQRLANPYKVLLSSLEKIRRRDVKEKVEELLMESQTTNGLSV